MRDGVGLERAWSRSDVFSRTYTLFGLLMVMAFVAQTLYHHWQLTVILLLSLPVYFIVEQRLSDVLTTMATSSSYFNLTPYFLILWALLLLGFSCGVSLLVHISEPFDMSLCSSYLRSLVSSVLIFLFSSAFKCFAVGTGLIDFKLTRRGFFAIFQRLFLIFRNIWILPFWIGHFCSIDHPTFTSVFFAPQPYISLAYLVFKAAVQLWLLWEFGLVVRAYRVNGHGLYTAVPIGAQEEECVICMDAMVEPVMLRCGHKFCYVCLFRWLSSHSFCPTCRAPLVAHAPIECCNGSLPPAALFAAF
jgi:hypothetical protein